MGEERREGVGLGEWSRGGRVGLVVEWGGVGWGGLEWGRNGVEWGGVGSGVWWSGIEWGRVAWGGVRWGREGSGGVGWGQGGGASFFQTTGATQAWHGQSTK